MPISVVWSGLVWSGLVSSRLVYSVCSHLVSSFVRPYRVVVSSRLMYASTDTILHVPVWMSICSVFPVAALLPKVTQ
ncbi:hypothetical protein E2C01_087311 [Portunus trituberculatus]|uniref:Secreted protein n=1 Tax=Portunus trituberculatus TaxID=210409 RepID=A0A5B7JD01_PORTR|nr:hypothetical protein [Portunus trituberculatus]